MRLAPVAVALLAAALILPPAASARGFGFGTAAGEVTSSSARLWTRADRSGRVRLRVTRCGGRRPITKLLRARRDHDYAVQSLVRHLHAGQRYCYRFSMRGGRRSPLGRFTTAPAATQDRTIRFAWSGDTDAKPLPGKTTPYWPDFGVYGRMLAEGNDFNVNLGDTIYTDSEVPGTRVDALTVAQKWAKYRLNLAQPPLSRFRTDAATYSQWDDHEFYNDFSPQQNEFSNSGVDARRVRIDGHLLYRRGRAAFRDYTPVDYSRDLGTYGRFRWGRNLELFRLDERSFRSANADANHVCDNPSSHAPDYAPTSTGTLARLEFSLVVSSLRQPPPRKCLDTINDRKRTFLGTTQLARFMRDVESSKATFKVILNELPIQQYYVLPYDRWEGFEAERRRVLHFLHDHVRNVIFLTTDVHANLVNDARFQTLGPGGTQNSGITDITTGPVATRTFNRELNDEVGSTLVGPGVRGLVFKPPPPQGVGMSCAEIDTPSYGEVEVTNRTLTVTLKGRDGRPIGCAPIRLTAH